MFSTEEKSEILNRMKSILPYISYQAMFHKELEKVLAYTHKSENLFEFLNFFLDFLKEEKIEVNVEELYRILCFANNPSGTKEYMKFKKQRERNKQDYFTKYIKQDILNHPKRYQFNFCDVLRNFRNEKILIVEDTLPTLDEKTLIIRENKKLVDVVLFHNIKDFIRNNFVEVSSLSDGRLEKILYKIDEKVVDNSVEIDKRFYRLFYFYLKARLDLENENSFLRRLNYDEFKCSYKGFATEDSFLLINVNPANIFCMYFVKEDGIFKNKMETLNIDEIEKFLDDEIKELAKNELDKLKAELLFRDLQLF